MLLELDRRLASSVLLEFFGAGAKAAPGHVRFQFPPRITSDGKDIDWSEGPLRGGEPLAYFKTSGPRKIRLEWTYLIGESGGGGDNSAAKYWTVDDVRNEVSGLRWYFHNIGTSDPEDTGERPGSADATLICKFQMWYHGDPYNPFTARMVAGDIKHGKTLYVPTVSLAGATDVRRAYPLRTDIGVDLRLWTNGRDDEGSKQDLPLSTFYGSNGLPQWR